VLREDFQKPLTTPHADWLIGGSGYLNRPAVAEASWFKSGAGRQAAGTVAGPSTLVVMTMRRPSASAIIQCTYGEFSSGLRTKGTAAKEAFKTFKRLTA
jgi:hypothetical protein